MFAFRSCFSGQVCEALLKGRRCEEIRVVDNMVMSPTYTRDAAGMIRDILLKELPSGIYHVTNSGSCSWFDFAKGIFEMQDVDANLLPIKTSAPGSKAKRPVFWALMSARIAEYGPGMPVWDNGLGFIMREEAAQGSV
ncbi:MAG TPA: sugar nucleotide-binding protein [Candidatus Limnocylindrales bacterium]|nr:sugar nucleotide-binding protein [Candidatus Limnocylindrales bacterium]